MGEWRYSHIDSCGRHKTEISGQLHGPIALSSRGNSPRYARGKPQRQSKRLEIKICLKLKFPQPCYHSHLTSFTYVTTAAFQILLLKNLRIGQCTTKRPLDSSVGTVASYGLGDGTNRDSIYSRSNRFESSSKRPGRL